jgi:putative ATPase
MEEYEPLAYRMRPRTLEEVVGQRHLVGEGCVIYRMVAAKKLHSMILYGPPGVGKTSIGSAIAGSIKHAFRQMNAATDTKKDLQVIVDEARFSGTVILFLDEIHRLDKTKQDFLLSHLESGRIILIGATTENPYFSIHPAIRSRVQIFELYSLQEEDVIQALNNALKDKVRGLKNDSVQVLPEALKYLAIMAHGDLRSAFNILEIAAFSTSLNKEGERFISLDIIKKLIQKNAFAYDKDGDTHYDVISALQKSIRGSDVDASLYYAAWLMEAGELSVLMRRLLVIAYEDVGLANPSAVQRAVLAVQVAEKLGLPEARISLSNVIIELALSPKSNSAYLGIDKALSDIRKGRAGRIPDYLRDAHYQGAASLDRGVGYQYPHDEPNSWINQEYLPETLRGVTYYEPKQTGKYEQALAARKDQLKQWKEQDENSLR